MGRMVYVCIEQRMFLNTVPGELPEGYKSNKSISSRVMKRLCTGNEEAVYWLGDQNCLPVATKTTLGLLKE